MLWLDTEDVAARKSLTFLLAVNREISCTTCRWKRRQKRIGLLMLGRSWGRHWSVLNVMPQLIAVGSTSTVLLLT